MRIFPLTVTLLFAAASARPAAADLNLALGKADPGGASLEEPPAIAISISSDHADYVLGQEINLVITVTNVGEPAQVYPEIDPMRGFTLQVLDPAGAPCALRQPGKGNGNVAWYLPRNVAPLKPREVRSMILPLGNLFRMDALGSYQVKASITCPSENLGTIPAFTAASARTVSILPLVIEPPAYANVFDSAAFRKSDPDGTAFPAGPYELTVRPDRVRYQAGDAIHLKVNLKNVSQEARTLILSHRDDSYDFEVIQPDQNVAGLNEAGKNIYSSRDMIFSLHSGTLQPGQSRQVVLNLNRYYTLTQTGTYTLILGEEVDEFGHHLVPVKSDPVTFEVVAKTEAAVGTRK